ncbi:uncharacterized protein LOC141686997 [Apium graveolens]|uniref:uncharacterized protein LOC141686997 n=1 Tax=Apium graveolens TaxID=4045 RepID=UPI003D7B9E33
MSLVLKLRGYLPNGLFLRPNVCRIAAFNSNGLMRKYALVARKEEVEEVGEEVGEEYDQRRLPTDYNPATFDPMDHRSPPTERVWRLVDETTELTLLETAELGAIMMRKVGMSDQGAGLDGMGAMGGSAAEEAMPEKTAFELKLESFDAAVKIKVIKEVRACTDLGLKESKEMVEKVPAVFKKGVTKEEGEKIIEKMKAVGAKVVME